MVGIIVFYSIQSSFQNTSWVSFVLFAYISFILIFCSVQVFELGGLIIKSRSDIHSHSSSIKEQSNILEQLPDSTCNRDFILGFKLRDLYNNFEVQLDNCEVCIVFSVWILLLDYSLIVRSWHFAAKAADAPLSSANPCCWEVLCFC